MLVSRITSLISLQIFHVLLLSSTFASDPTSDTCPTDQYRNNFGVCVNCSSCQAPRNVVIKRCYAHSDTICGTLDDMFYDYLKKKQIPMLEPLTMDSKESSTTKNKGIQFIESESTYNLMLHGLKDQLENHDAVKIEMKNGKDKVKKNDPSREELSKNFKTPFDINGKHIKKDLSAVDIPLSETALRQLFLNHWYNKTEAKKNKDRKLVDKSEPKKNKNKDVVVKKETKKPRNHSLTTVDQFRLNKELTDKFAIILKAAVISRNRTRPHIFKTSDFDDLKNTDENLINEDDTDDDDEADDDEDEDEEDEDEDYADDDDDNKENDDDENESEDVDEDKDEDADEENLDSSTSIIGKSKINLRPFSGNRVIRPASDNTDDVDYDDPVAYVEKPLSWPPTGNEVNVEPFIDSSNWNWQVLVLVSAVSACLLFFVVLNAYLCIYMKRWKHMKQDFEAGNLDNEL